MFKNKNKKKWSKKAKILTWTIAPTVSLVLGGGIVIGAVAGTKMHQLHEEQFAFDQVYQVSNTNTNGKDHFDPGLKQDKINENNFTNSYNDFFNSNQQNSGKTIALTAFIDNLQDKMLALFPQFKIKLGQIKDQIDSSALKNYSQMKLLKNGFVKDALNLINDYTKKVNDPSNDAITDHINAFATFFTGLGNLIKTYMVIPFNQQLSPNGHYTKYLKKSNQSNGQNLLITLLYDHTLLDISNALFRQSIEAPIMYLNQLLNEGYHIQKTKKSVETALEMTYLKVLTGPIGIQHISDVFTLSSAMDGVVFDINKNLDDILSHPIFHKKKTKNDKTKIEGLISLFRDMFNTFVEVPKNKSEAALYSLNLYVKNGVSNGKLDDLIRNEIKKNSFTFWNDSVNSKYLYTSSTTMESFIVENTSHFMSIRNPYIQEISKINLSSNWLK